MDICPFCGSQEIKYNTKKEIYCCLDCWEEFGEPQQRTEGMRLFFSYGHDKNKELVEKIKAYLENRGHSIWIDESEIKAGENWRRKIFDGVRGSDGVIAFLSKHSVRNPGVCRDELRIALCVRSAQIKSILTENERSVEPPSSLSEDQWLDMSQWEEMKAQGEEAYGLWFELKMQELTRVIESNGMVAFNGEIELLKRMLQPNLSYSKEYRLAEKPLIGRKWLTEIIEKWSGDREKSRVLLIEGTAGSGKSAFSAHSAHYDRHITASAFFEWNIPESYTLRSFIKTLAFKLGVRLADYRSVLLQLVKNEGMNAFSDEMLMEYLIIDPLNALVDGNRDACVVLLDGLDEIGDEGKKLPLLLAGTIKKLPRWVKLIITSRPDEELKTIFEDMTSVSLSDDVFGDISTYLQERLGTDKYKSWDIAARCEGSFLYAENLCDAFSKGEMLLEDIFNMPCGMAGFYYMNFERSFKCEEDYRSTRQLLELLAVEGSMPRKLIMDMLSLDGYGFVEIMSHLKTVVVTEYPRNTFLNKGIDEAMVSFHHKSVGEWLTDKIRAGKFFVDRNKGMDSLSAYGVASIYNNMYTVSDRNKDRAYVYIYNNIARWLTSTGKFEEYERLLIEKEAERKKLWETAQYGDDFFNSFEAYSFNLWSSLSKFPKDYDVERLHGVFHDAIGTIRRILHRSIYSCTRMYSKVFGVFSSQLHHDFMRNEFISFIREAVMPAFFMSGASDEYQYNGLPFTFNADKIFAARALDGLRDEYLSLGYTLPDDVEEKIENFRLSALYCEGKLRDVRTIHYNFPRLFAGRINKAVIPEGREEQKRAKTEFNTYCLYEHMIEGKGNDLEYIMELFFQGADLELFKEILNKKKRHLSDEQMRILEKIKESF